MAPLFGMIPVTGALGDAYGRTGDIGFSDDLVRQGIDIWSTTREQYPAILGNVTGAYPYPSDNMSGAPGSYGTWSNTGRPPDIAYYSPILDSFANVWSASRGNSFYQGTAQHGYQGAPGGPVSVGASYVPPASPGASGGGTGAPVNLGAWLPWLLIIGAVLLVLKIAKVL